MLESQLAAILTVYTEVILGLFCGNAENVDCVKHNIVIFIGLFCKRDL